MHQISLSEAGEDKSLAETGGGCPENGILHMMMFTLGVPEQGDCCPHTHTLRDHSGKPPSLCLVIAPADAC